jgi:sugar/nucleoside kinase (ribokinase family)
MRMPYMESLRALIRAVGVHEKDIMRMCDENMFSLEFLCSQTPTQAEATEVNGAGDTSAAGSMAEYSGGDGGDGGGESEGDGASDSEDDARGSKRKAAKKAKAKGKKAAAETQAKKKQALVSACA